MLKAFKNRDRYRNELLLFLEPYINWMILFGAFGALLSVLNTIIFRPDDLIPLIFNSVLSVGLFVLYIFRKRISVHLKISIPVSFLTLFGATLILFTEYELAGVLLIFLNVLLMIFFQESRFQIPFIIISTAVILYGFIANTGGDVFQLSKYAYSFTIYLVLIFIAPITFRTIFHFLYDKLDLIEQKLEEEEKTIELLQTKNKEIEKLAYYDSLTSLINRSRLSALLDKDLMTNEESTLIFIDIKSFNKINSLYGIKHADDILKEIAKQISDAVTEKGYVGYLGANWFALYFMKILSQSDFLTLMQKLQNSINQSLALALTVELYSLCLFPTAGKHQAEYYYKLASEYLSLMKQGGVLVRYVDAVEKEKFIENDLRKQFVLGAIENKSYEVHYQQKLDSRTGTIVGVEALARLRKDGQYISPGIFIPIVESDEHVISFGYLIMELVFSQYQKITRKFADVIISINLSPKQLADKDLVENAKRLMQKYQVDPKRLEFEITEDQLISNISDFTRPIKALKQLGIKFSIDDFGTGYSSLGYLSELPIDVIKIDKSFIDTIDQDPKRRAIVRAIVDIAKAAHLEIVAEGVETEQQLAVLTAMEVYVIQGYLYSKPEPI